MTVHHVDVKFVDKFRRGCKKHRTVFQQGSDNVYNVDSLLRPLRGDFGSRLTRFHAVEDVRCEYLRDFNWNYTGLVVNVVIRTLCDLIVILTVARLVASILLPATHSPVSFLWSSLLLATSPKKLSNAHRVSRFGAGNSCIKCCRASCCNRLFLISEKMVTFPELVMHHAGASIEFVFYQL